MFLLSKRCVLSKFNIGEKYECEEIVCKQEEIVKF